MPYQLTITIDGIYDSDIGQKIGGGQLHLYYRSKRKADERARHATTGIQSCHVQPASWDGPFEDDIEY